MINLNKIAHKITSNILNVSSTVVPEMTYNKDGDKEWRVNGFLHREDGPALERKNGDKEWYINNKLHREDGPAIEYANGAKSWYINGKRHREDGPAIEYANGNKLWYLNGNYVKYDPKTWNQIIRDSQIENIMKI